MDAVIRTANVADDAELARIDYESWAPVNSPSPLWERSRPFFGEQTRTSPADVLVAQRTGIVLGYVKLRRIDDSTVRLAGLAVDRRARRAGIGQGLLSAALAEARTRGYTRADLKVLGSNHVALELYRRAGFVELERVPGRFVIEGRKVDDLTLAIAL
ncbi:GNAT family N-acetyltransferase [Microbacterium sp.]|uniref:GNAT family N-acetyltransferase n=1 Tax=Microbacterium sp. TaxID=51671 RepID=UPI002812184A|nr:GNAT family N-acetyltransferase [Microbacterium sp.]